MCLLSLVGCAERGDVEVVAEPRPLTTPTPIPPDQPNLQPGAPPTPTQSAAQLQATQAALDPCLHTSLRFTNSVMGSVHWRADAAGNVYCCQRSFAISQTKQNPEPASRLAIFSVLTESGRPSKSAYVLVDLTDGAYKILGRDYIDSPKYIADWLPNERVVWADGEGEVYIGALESQESLNAPAKMTDLWFVPPDRILTRDDALQFWFYDLTKAAWTPLPEGESEKITIGWVDHAAASDDGSYVFFHFESYVAILSSATETFEIIRPAEGYSILPGEAGDSFSPPRQIKDTAYWFFYPNEIFREFSGISYLLKGFVVDSRTGEVLEHEALGIPPELAIYRAYLSPERTWAAVEVIENAQALETRPVEVSQTWYISLATAESRVEEGAFAGWAAEGEDYLNAPLACEQREITIDLGP